jgi:hypothetical protein
MRHKRKVPEADFGLHPGAKKRAHAPGAHVRYLERSDNILGACEHRLGHFRSARGQKLDQKTKQ